MAGLIALAVAGLAVDRLGTVALWADLAVLAALLVDWFRTPYPGSLDVRRSLPGRAGLSQEFARLVRIDAGPAGGLELELREEFPPAFEVVARTVLTDRVPVDPASLDRRRAPRTAREPERARADDAADEALPPGTVLPLADDPTGGPDAVRLPRSGPIDLVRVYRSGRRGVHAVGDMRLRLTGPFGLVQRQARLAGERRIAIEPALVGLKRTLKLAASERWKDLGVRFVRRRGGMTEFESLRDHVHGDDVRRIDWKAFAKRGRPTVRQFQEERGQELILCFDCGRRMGATTAERVAGYVPGYVSGHGGHVRGRSDLSGWTKLDHAFDAGLELAAVALSRGDRVGLIAFDARVLAYVAPARGAHQLRRLREAIFALQPSRLEADLARGLRELGLRHRRSALLVVLSDLADPLSVEPQTKALAAGSRRHKIVFAGLDDPSLRLAAEGALATDAGVRAVALELAHERRAGLARLRRSGLRVIDALPAEAAGPLLGAWLEERRSG